MSSRSALLFAALTALLAHAPSAHADVIEMPTSCPAGQTMHTPEGCPSHGSPMTCRWSSCSDSDECSDNTHCVEHRVCVRDVERTCSEGDGRASDSMRRFTRTEHERGQACGANDACPSDYTCEAMHECAPASDQAPEVGGCTIARGSRGGVWGLLGLVMALLAFRRRRAVFRATLAATITTGLLGVVALAAIPVQADMVGAPPSNCPIGSIGRASGHSGEFCAPHDCVNPESCAGFEGVRHLGGSAPYRCESAGVCVVERSYTRGGRQDPAHPPQPQTRDEVVGRCDSTADCDSGSCVFADRCVPGSPEPSETSRPAADRPEASRPEENRASTDTPAEPAAPASGCSVSAAGL